MKVKISKNECEPYSLRDLAIESLVKICSDIKLCLVEAYKEYKETCEVRNLSSVVCKPFRKLEPEEALLKSMTHVIEATAKRNPFRKDAAKRFDFMIFRYSPEIFDVDDKTYHVKILNDAKEMKDAAKETVSCIKDREIELFEKWENDPGTIFGIVYNEKEEIQGYFRNYFYEDNKGNLVIGMDTTEPNKNIFFEKGKWEYGIKIIGFSALATAIFHCDYVLSDHKLKHIRIPSKYHSGDLKKLGEDIKLLYSYTKHHKSKRRKAIGINCFNEYFQEKVKKKNKTKKFSYFSIFR